VLIQTALPGHYAIRAALEHDLRGLRRPRARGAAAPEYPPHTRLANIVISGTDERAVQDAAQATADWVRALVDRADAGSPITITGPAPCAIDRIRGRWRWHFLLRSRSARVIGTVCRQLQTRSTSGPVRPSSA
jgi:primosomal protein N' (replication factor Y) (superfamily II helicase)